MKATLALVFLGLCAAAPLQQRQDDPDAPFITATPAERLKPRHVVPPGLLPGGTSGHFSCTEVPTFN